MNRWFAIALALVACGPPNTVPPEQGARDFVAALGFKPGAVTCRPPSIGSTVTVCTARVADSEKTFAIECPALGNTGWRGGCYERLPR